MEILKRLSTPTPEFLMRVEGYRRIWKEYPELLRLGNEKWSLEEKEVLEQLECLCKEIKGVTGKNIESVGSTLVIIAAWLGEIWVENCDGAWQWNDHANTCTVKSCSTGHVLLNPLGDVLYAWEYGTDRMIEDFKDYYEQESVFK